MYILYTDKPGLFECSISLENASVKNSKARLLVEAGDMDFIFKGTIDSSGKCKIPIKKLKNILEESTKGKIKLEVIADDTYFTPWESDFTVETSKKVAVEIKSNSNKKDILENKFDKTKLSNYIQDISKKLIKENITIENISYQRNKLNSIINPYIKKNNIKDNEKDVIIEGIVSFLSVLSIRKEKPKQDETTLKNLFDSINQRYFNH
jgi:hypothetical protein